jgi:hypothetical protein
LSQGADLLLVSFLGKFLLELLRLGLLLILKLHDHGARLFQLPALRAHAFGRAIELGFYGVQFLRILLLNGRQPIRDLIPQLPIKVISQLALLRRHLVAHRIHTMNRKEFPYGQSRESDDNQNRFDNVPRV